MSIEYSALESGLDRFVKLDKDHDFVGKNGLVDWQKKGFENSFVTLEVFGITDADARGSEAIYYDGNVVGRATSGGFGFRVDKSLALGLVKPEFSSLETDLEIEILGKRYAARVLAESPFDPENARLKG